MIICGDALTELKKLPDNSIDCCVTSPPYYNLRDYGSPGQIGLEPTLREYIEKLVAVFHEVKRVLRPSGTLWLNIADSYAGSTKGATRDKNVYKYKQGTNKGLIGANIPPTPKNGCKAKDLLGVPWELAFALRADGWYLRQEIIWQKPNCMPESVKDRCTKSHETIFLFAKSKRYYFDWQAIQEPCIGFDRSCPRGSRGTLTPNAGRREEGAMRQNPSDLRRKRSVWTVSTIGSRENHFATFPPKLIEPCILAGAPVGGIVLDPFAGSGTVGLVAKQHNRGYVLIDISPDYMKIIKKKLNIKE